MEKKITAEEVTRVYEILKKQFEQRRKRLRELEEARAAKEQPARQEGGEA